jgi:hypothetical protein
MIDVVWLKGKAVQAAFEVEATTSIYSGLLRMADLIAMVPNLEIPLFIVAPDWRREKVLREIGRPAFMSLPKPMAALCGYIWFSRLKEQAANIAPFIKHVDPKVVKDWAEYLEKEGAP